MKEQGAGADIRRKRLGRSGLLVSEVGLGTMNFGSQLSESASHAVLDAAVDMGITFIDTAEMYASPPSADSFGRSEEIIGQWLTRHDRDAVVIATKIVGPPDGRYQSGAHVRHGQATLDRFHIASAIDGSLRRLRTDHVDLLQFHWPDRSVPWQEQLEAVHRAREAGKVRYFGCSNESAWGLMRAIACSERYDLPRPVSVQNVLNWLEQDEYAAVEEVCREEGLGYIAYSPLAMGLLSGKYGGDIPVGSRFGLYERYRAQYLNEWMTTCVAAFTALAKKRGVSTVRLALAWALTRSAAAVVLTSASRVDQLRDLAAAVELAQAEPDLALPSADEVHHASTRGVHA